MSNLTDFTNTFLEQSEFYGFKKTNGTGSQLEDLIVHYTNGVDNLVAAVPGAEYVDVFTNSFLAKRGLSFSVDSNGNLLLSV
jgi:hypothetical protein